MGKGEQEGKEAGRGSQLLALGWSSSYLVRTEVVDMVTPNTLEI